MPVLVFLVFPYEEFPCKLCISAASALQSRSETVVTCEPCAHLFDCRGSLRDPNVWFAERTTTMSNGFAATGIIPE